MQLLPLLLLSQLLCPALGPCLSSLGSFTFKPPSWPARAWWTLEVQMLHLHCHPFTASNRKEERTCSVLINSGGFPQQSSVDRHLDDLVSFFINLMRMQNIYIVSLFDWDQSQRACWTLNYDLHVGKLQALHFGLVSKKLFTTAQSLFTLCEHHLYFR